MLYNYITTKRNDSAELINTMDATASNLINNDTSPDHPGILLGMIQSGKTRAYIGVLAKCFDNGYDVAIVLTKSSKALVQQTVQRIKSEFRDPLEHDYLKVYNIMSLPQRLTPFILSKKLVFVVKKEDDNLRRLDSLFFETQPDLSKKRVLIIDDEADFASVTYASDRRSTDGIRYGKLASMLSDFRNQLSSQSDYLQVTATPYSLYLQPENIVVDNGDYAPLRPRFTEILEPHNAYIGGEYYFKKSLDITHPSSSLYIPVSSTEFDKLNNPHRRYLETILETQNLRSFRFGLINFLVGGSIRAIQEDSQTIDTFQSPWKKAYKASYLIHTAQRTKLHQWQAELTRTLLSKLKDLIVSEPQEFHKLIKCSYRNLSISIKNSDFHLPGLSQTLEKVKEALQEGQIGVREINSVASVIDHLDDNGQLRLDNPFNIFIGGQVLDRGITIDNLIGFFYGRSPRSFQMDTVLQHSRMYGSRNQMDLAVTRIYTSPRIHTAMKNMYESDSALRDSIKVRGNDATIKFLKMDSAGIRPCSPSKIRISNIQTLRRFTRMLPVGFQTVCASKLSSITKAIDNILPTNATSQSSSQIRLDIKTIERIIDLIASSHVYSEFYENVGFEWHVEGFKEALKYLIQSSEDDKINVLIRNGRNISRKKNFDTAFTDAPDDGRNDLSPAKQLAQDKPVLILLKQNGLKEKGWRGTSFYWPVLIAPRNTKTCIYSSN